MYLGSQVGLQCMNVEIEGDEDVEKVIGLVRVAIYSPSFACVYFSGLIMFI